MSKGLLLMRELEKARGQDLVVCVEVLTHTRGVGTPICILLQVTQTLGTDMLGAYLL